MRDYARIYNTSIKDLRLMPLREFLRDYQEAAEELEQEKKQAEKKMPKIHKPHIRRR